MDLSKVTSFQKQLADYQPGVPFSAELTMHSGGGVEVFYSPFEFVNTDAKICIVGISPGATQANNANVCASNLMQAGESWSSVAQQAKQTASFSGALRNNLVAMLDYLGIAKHLGLGSASQLFTSHSSLLHCTSAFCYPTVLSGKPISSANQGLKIPALKQMVDECLVKECQQLSRDVLYIPLGQGVEDILFYLAQQGVMAKRQILSHLPHPSGASSERISYFLGRKSKANLSVKTNPHKMDERKRKLIAQLKTLGITPLVLDGCVESQGLGVNNATSNEITPQAAEKPERVASRTENQAGDLRDSKGFMLERVERSLRKELLILDLELGALKSQTSKELAILRGGNVLAYVSRRTALKDSTLMVTLHPAMQVDVDEKVGLLSGVSVRPGKGSRYVSSSNYRGFNSKGYTDAIETSEHIGVAYNVDVSNGFDDLLEFLTQLPPTIVEAQAMECA